MADRSGPQSPAKRRRFRLTEAGRLIRRLYGYVSDKRGVIVLALFSMVIHAACRAYPIYLLEKVMEDVLLAGGAAPGEALRALITICATLMVVASVGAIAYFFDEYFFKYISTWVVTRLRADLMEHMLRLPLSFFHKKRQAYLVSRLTNDVQVTAQTVNIFVSEIVQHPITIASFVVVAVSISWQLSLVALPLLVMVALPVVLVGRTVKKRSRRGLESLEDTTQVMLQTISGVRAVKSFRAEEAELDRFRKANDVFRDRTLKVVRAKATSRGLMDFLYQGLIAVLFFLGGWMMIGGAWGLSASSVVAFLVAMTGVYRPVKRLAQAYGNFQESLGGASRIFELLDASTGEDQDDGEQSGGTRRIGPIREGISVEAVSFAYDDENQAVLEDVSFHLARGERVALVGRSGSGKSTLTDLIGGFYKPRSGRITVDGVDLSEVDRASWLEKVSFVSQHPFVFNTTARENILYGRPDATEDEMIAAARAARVHDVIAALPRGYDTVVGERGVNLSGGELQRLTIARAILKDADLLILDEATSSLDSESERLVQEAIDRLAEGRTALVVAHRLSTVRDADRIVVLDRGRVIETGTHDELIARGGAYARLHELQLAAR